MRTHNLLTLAATVFATPVRSAPVVFHVSLGQASTTSVSGRLLVFAKPLGPADKEPLKRVDNHAIDFESLALSRFWGRPVGTSLRNTKKLREKELRSGDVAP